MVPFSAQGRVVARVVLTSVAVCAQCCTCNFCGCGEIFEFIFAGLGTAWWAVASVVLMQKSFAANNANIPVRTCGTHPQSQTAGLILYMVLRNI